VSCPGLFEDGRELDTLVESVDCMPMVLELAGIEVPASVSGKSFKGLLDGATTEHKSMIYSAFNEYSTKPRCVRTRRYCYSYGYITDDGVTGEMYDLEKDPEQRYNVYDEPDYRTVRDELMRKLLEFEIGQSYQLHVDRPELAWRYPPSQHLY
jgi:arylsulfatase A-like enzyme